MGRVTDLLSNIKNSPKKFGFNSFRYYSIQRTASKYAKKMEEPVTQKSAIELSRLEEELKNKTAKYLEKRRDPKTQEGKARYNYVEQVSNLVGVNDELRDNYRRYQAEGKRLADVVDVVRNNQIVDITNEEKQIVGAGASKRIKFKYAGETGFFTPNSTVKNFGDFVKETNEKFEKANPELWKKMKNNHFVQEDENMPIMGAEKYTDEVLLDLLAMTTGTRLSDFNEKELEKITAYYRDLTKADTAQDTLQDAHIDERDGLEKRNVATSRVANLLGMQDKIATAKNIKVIDNGVEMEGSFMQNAVGLDSRSHNGKIKLMKEDLDLTAGSLQRDINRMQVLDMVCGQIDRHGGNFFYQVSEQPINGKYQIVGLQGIDNDMSFGNIRNIDVKQKSLAGLDSLKVIDEEALRYLKEASVDQFKFAVGEILNNDEIDAVMVRRNAILDKVANGDVRIVKANEWGAGTLEESKKSPYYQEINKEITFLEHNDLERRDTLIASYDKRVSRVEEYNRLHPDSMQELPERPKNYDLFKEQQYWRNNNPAMVAYDEQVANAKFDGLPIPPQPEGYEKYKAEKEIYSYVLQKQVYDSEIEETGKSSMQKPKEPENFAERRKALLISYLQPKMDAYKEDFENNYEKQMEDYEKQVREAVAEKKPLPEMPGAYLEYKKFKDLEKSPAEVSLDELSGKSKTVTRMQSNVNQPKREMGMAPNGK